MATARRMGSETSETRARILDVTKQIMLGRVEPAPTKNRAADW
jgi:hypothetical protein